MDAPESGSLAEVPRPRHEEPAAADDKSPTDLSHFSLVSGGPLYQLWRRARLAGEGMQGVQRRVLVLVLLTWAPLLLLSLAEGRAWGGGVLLPFLMDVETHVRLLIAVPLLILAELMTHR
jgi:hypothetical protein